MSMPRFGSTEAGQATSEESHWQFRLWLKQVSGAN